MKTLTEHKEWNDLANHRDELANQHMRDWFAEDKKRFSRFTLLADDIFLDYSRNRVTDKTITLLCNLANSLNLKDKIEGLFTGQRVNTTEDRPALHTALRDKNHAPILVNGENITTMIAESQDKMRAFVTAVHTQRWTGVTGKPISHIVNIGIGGSHQGPMMCSEALKDFAVTQLHFHYISSIDDLHLHDVLQQIDPETTLFIVSSKSFTTIETITNAQTISAWLSDRLGHIAGSSCFPSSTPH